MFSAPRDDPDDQELSLNRSASMFMASGRDSMFSNVSQAPSASSHSGISSGYYGFPSSSASSLNAFPPQTSNIFAGSGRILPPSFAPPSSSGALGRGSASQAQSSSLSLSGGTSPSISQSGAAERNLFQSGNLPSPVHGKSSPSRPLATARRSSVTHVSAAQFRSPVNNTLRMGPLTAPPSSSASGAAGNSGNYFESNALDKEFPVLPKPTRQGSTNNVGNIGMANPIATSSFSTVSSQATRRAIYGILPKSHDDEFTIHNEDFPALPATSSFRHHPKSSFGLSNSLRGLSDSAPLSGSVAVETGREVGATRAAAAGIIGQRVKPAGVQSLQSSLVGGSVPELPSPTSMSNGIQTSIDGKVSNIPPGMVSDQFGMVGLLTFIRAAESEPSLVTLALGTDLTSLGLNLSTLESLHTSFTSPFMEWPARAQDVDYPVPSEYYTRSVVGEKLAPIKLHRYCEDLLFYLYYHSCGDVLQLAASAELYQRDWRFHKEEHVWLQRVPGMEPAVKDPTYERGRYHVFEVGQWATMTREMHIQYDQLEDCPRLPPNRNMS